MNRANRILILTGTLYGALGVVMAAMAGHAMPGSTLGPGAQFLMIHACALVALATALETALIAPKAGQLGAFLILAGTALFSTDMALRAFLHLPLFPFAAPFGGFLMIGGWLLTGWAVLTAPRRAPDDGADHGPSA